MEWFEKRNKFFESTTTSIQNRPYYFKLASFFVNCDFSKVGIFFWNLISDNESSMFWHSFAEISTQNFNSLRRNRNLQKWSINVNKLNRGCIIQLVYSPGHIIRLRFICGLCGLRGAEEVDEAEDYEALGSNPGQELWIMKMCFSIRKAISNSLHRAARSGTGPTPSSDICERHMLVTWYQKWVEVEPQRRIADVVGSWCRRRNISS